MAYKIDTCCFLARCLVLLRKGNDRWPQCRNKLGIRSWDWSLDFCGWQHYKVGMCMHCHKSVLSQVWKQHKGAMIVHCHKSVLSQVRQQDNNIVMSVHCHKSVPIIIWPEMLLGHKTTTNKQSNKHCTCHCGVSSYFEITNRTQEFVQLVTEAVFSGLDLTAVVGQEITQLVQAWGLWPRRQGGWWYLRCC